MKTVAVAASPAPPRALLAAAVGLLASLSLAAGRPAGAAEGAEPSPTPSCSTLARVPGPEDLVLDEERDRLLVSSQDRRPEPWPPGEIWAVPLDATRRPYRLDLAGRGYACSFHPHGIDLVESCDGRLLLYVLNHHDAADRLPERACFGVDELRVAPRGRIASVEVFEVEERGLRFLQRLANPEVLTNGNDLVALPNGDVWVTDPPAGGGARALELLGWSHSSRLVQFRCLHRRNGHCVGRWQRRTDPGDRNQRFRYANGIAFRPERGRQAECSDAGAGTLYVAGGASRRIHRFRVEGEERLVPLNTVRLPETPHQPNPDNLTWVDAGRTRLLAAGHPNLRRFLQHAQSSKVPSPSAVVELRFPNEGEGETVTSMQLFLDSGRLVSGASVAVCAGGDLVLGQVFEPAVIRCVLPAPCGGEEAR